MATLEKRGDSYRVIFYYQNVRFTRSLKTDILRKADELKRWLEGNLDLLEQGRLDYAPGKDDLPTLLLSDGKINVRPEPVKLMTLGDFFKKYKENRPPGKESNTTYTEEIHLAHLLRILGSSTALPDIPGKLQSYATTRSAEKNRQGDQISQVTVRKELGTLTSLWNRWATRQGIVSVQLSLRNLEYKKVKEKPAFQTWEQIKRRILRGKLTEDEQAELWDSLYLTMPEVEALLAHVKSNGSIIRERQKFFPWVFPMFCFAAYTGARRSEILRSRQEDIDFENGEVTIREKKKDRSKEETHRHVPMAQELREALEDWLKVHPGGPLTFCKKENEPLTEQMATHYLRWTLDGSKWKVVRGWHVFRHSLISGLASRSVPDRIIMEIVGHLNRETTRRYQHIVPSTVRDALGLLFGQRSLVPEPGQLVVGDEPATAVG